MTMHHFCAIIQSALTVKECNGSSFNVEVMMMIHVMNRCGDSS